MGWVLIGLGLVLSLAGITAVLGIVRHTSLLRDRTVITERWEALKTELDRRHQLVPPLARTVASSARQERPALEDLLTVQDQAARLKRLDQLPQRAGGEERLAAGLRRARVTASNIPGLAGDRGFLSLVDQLDQAGQRIAEATTAYNLAVDSYRQRVNRGWSQRVDRLAGWPVPSRFAARSRQFAEPHSPQRAQPDGLAPTAAPVVPASRPPRFLDASPATLRAMARTPQTPAGERPIPSEGPFAPSGRPVTPGTGAVARPAPADDTRDTRPTFIPSYDPFVFRPTPDPVTRGETRPAGQTAACGRVGRPATPPTTGQRPSRPGPNPTLPGEARPTPVEAPAKPLGVLDFWRSNSTRPVPPIHREPRD